MLNLYWDQQATVRLILIMSKYVEVKQDVRQRFFVTTWMWLRLMKCYVWSTLLY